MRDLRAMAVQYLCAQLILARLDIVGGCEWHCPHDPEPMCRDAGTM